MNLIRKPGTFVAGCLLTLAVAGCSAATTASIEAPGVIRKNIGLASAFDLADIGKSTFQRYQYVVQREEGAPQLLLESRWRDRQAFSDEAPEGTLARTRVILTGRPSSRSTSGAGQLYDVTISVENQIQAMSGEWAPAQMTPQLTAYVQDIVGYLEGRLRSVTRRFGTPPPAGAR